MRASSKFAAFVLTVIGTRTYGKEYKVGDEVMAIASRQLHSQPTDGTKSGSSVEPGELLAVQEFKDGWMLVKSGWLHQQFVVPLNRAADHIGRELERDPDSVEWLYARATLSYRDRKFDSAIADFSELIGRYPDLMELRVARGKAWSAKGDQDRAIADCNEALRLDPKSSRGYALRGRIWSEKGEHDKAIADYSEAVRLNPKDSASHYERGRAWFENRNDEKAIADFGEALRLNPNDSDAYLGRGLVYSRKREVEKAIADYNEALRLDPKSLYAYSSRALAWSRKGDQEKAIADLDQALRLDPQSALAYVYRGGVWFDKAEYGKAVADYEKALALKSKYVVALNNLAWLRATCPDEQYRNGQKAVEHATLVCELTQWKVNECIDSLAAAHAEAGNFAKAVEYAEKALKDCPESQRKKAEERLALYRAGKPFHEPAAAKK